MAWKLLVGALAAAGALAVILYGSLKEELQLWKYVDEVLADPRAFHGKRLNVGGHVRTLIADRGSLQYDFEVESRPPRARAVIKAHYQGIVPDTFKTGAEVVATGTFTPDGSLATDTIMAKCPSKY